MSSNGYGKLEVGGKSWQAHRYYYVQKNGPIPDGLVADHLCRVRNCVNPDHLDIVTQKENVRRGLAAAKTHCFRGHPLEEGNLTYDRFGYRQCLQCRRLRDVGYKTAIRRKARAQRQSN